MQHKGGFVVLDFGSQLTQLIARRLRELHVYSEILPFDTPLEKIKALAPKGIILSGGPSSVHEEGSPYRNISELKNQAPLLGICYGMQLIASDLGGVVEQSSRREYGFNSVNWKAAFSPKLEKQLGQNQRVWMSHGDIVKVPPPGFELIGLSETNHAAAMKGENVWAVQFHPEVTHTENGIDLLSSFVFDFCKAEPNWNPPQIAEQLMAEAQLKVGEKAHVICGLSGGVDSSVAATLLTKALGKNRVHCIFVNNGLLRKNEYESVLKNYEGHGLNVKGVDAVDLFMRELKGLEDPELKRKAIGKVFIDVFQSAADRVAIEVGHKPEFLAQGTLYPDVIESVPVRGASVTIKSHHNVGGLPAKMNMKLVEPLRELFKDEVRAIGKQIGLPAHLIDRHPFPGPGLAIRIMGEVNHENLEIVREADDIYIGELRSNNLYHNIWQAFCVLLPVKTVGVQGDGRTYEKVLALRAVTSTDGMTADWYPFQFEFMRKVSNRITNEVKGVNRVVYDVTSKPPGTIEWE